jgi:membrane protein implicated in regulation of membrane protease activity
MKVHKDLAERRGKVNVGDTMWIMDGTKSRAFNDPEFVEVENKGRLLFPAPHLTHLPF